VTFEVSERPNASPVIDSGPNATPNPARAGQSVAFMVTARDPDGDPLACAWDYGDGAQGSGATATHAYAAAGTYTATVVVTDGKGGRVEAAVGVEVIARIQGDLNGDGLVNIDDLTLVTKHFGKEAGSAGWDPAADANGDGRVNVDDLTAVTSNFGAP
jgi:hypothetical protein